MSLLAQRGSSRRRSRSGWLQWAGGVVRTLVGGRSRDVLPSRSANTAGLGILAAALACMGTGYVLGNAFPWAGDAGLRAPSTPRHGVAPGPIGDSDEMRPLASRYLMTSIYGQKTDAVAAARTLRQAGIAMAGVQQVEHKGTTYFGLVVYFDGDGKRDEARSALLEVVAPDAVFEHQRKTQKGWPLEMPVR